MQDIMLGMAFREGHAVKSVREQADGSLLIHIIEDTDKTACSGMRGGSIQIHLIKKGWPFDHPFDLSCLLSVAILKPA